MSVILILSNFISHMIKIYHHTAIIIHSSSKKKTSPRTTCTSYTSSTFINANYSSTASYTSFTCFINYRSYTSYTGYTTFTWKMIVFLRITNQIIVYYLIFSFWKKKQNNKILPSNIMFLNPNNYVRVVPVKWVVNDLCVRSYTNCTIFKRWFILQFYASYSNNIIFNLRIWLITFT